MSIQWSANSTGTCVFATSAHAAVSAMDRRTVLTFGFTLHKRHYTFSCQLRGQGQNSKVNFNKLQRFKFLVAYRIWQWSPPSSIDPNRKRTYLVILFGVLSTCKQDKFTEQDKPDCRTGPDDMRRVCQALMLTHHHITTLSPHISMKALLAVVGIAQAVSRALAGVHARLSNSCAN